jgi:hypothetical protein
MTGLCTECHDYVPNIHDEIEAGFCSKMKIFPIDHLTRERTCHNPIRDSMAQRKIKERATMVKRLEHDYVFMGRSESGEVLTFKTVRTTFQQAKLDFQRWKEYNKNPIQEFYQRRGI